jgi:hypothetical protein
MRQGVLKRTGARKEPMADFHVGFEVLTAVVMNFAFFCDIVPCGPYVNRRSGGTYRPYLQSRISIEQKSSLQQVGGQIVTFLYRGAHNYWYHGTSASITLNL